RTVRRNFDERPRIAEKRLPSTSGDNGTQFDEQSSDSFGNLATKPASNGCLIIEDALAHLECTVQSYLESGDRTLIYAVAEQGEMLDSDGITAIQHRKSGRHY
ncbi:MAG: hypothetical protein RLZZ69_2486, partial [Cyanobacteriota bacterium]